MKRSEIISVIEKTALPASAAQWDRSGIQVAGHDAKATALAVCLDPTPAAVAAALDLGADVILSHHPLVMAPRALDTLDDHHAVASAVLARGAWLYAAHTSLDANPDGPVGWLARELSLTAPEVLEPTLRQERLTRCIVAATTPAPHWAHLPGVLAYRVLGNTAVISCEAADWPAIRAAILADACGSDTPRDAAPAFLPAEPELPARIFGFGLVGDLPEPLEFTAFVRRLHGLAGRAHCHVSGPAPTIVRRVGYCTGSGSSLADAAFARDADVFVTGDVKYHTALEARGCLLDVGHFALEEEMMRRFAHGLRTALPGLPVHFLPSSDPLRLHLPVPPTGTDGGRVPEHPA
ncbi:MAG: Nif3-like dinuclear metal center hexameric protein [Desulfovibrio sp.]|jgi:dinuclear metal center YbgI/SA1388 family protein|nr:Nif3-like dinuclear metal center hexameric protein [Desulfovibrio sp.]